ncbi:sigma-70 family RNA polymerase sigma factor [Saccharibacillus alkalitolerans]|uniref:Sigma-70 family RNA polymerase sigma factor n=1 Tax=Saccharibacillus alkalitolerans TaxID=2705290 RepID=A0ABX0F9X0_9BACL|nr:sigma-70 family RNA polymerase sigma factor [Saccharibacillus alkalitolerans]NGZ77736.1 sigma-70 family RNA polymerase sigma factor [Saccharibacillus alkalitolerans]
MNSSPDSPAFDELVCLAAEGNASAFAELIGAERPQLLRVAGYYVRNPVDAEDAVQEAVCRAFAAVTSIREPKYFRTWLTRIVINASLNLLQRGRRTVPSGDAAERLPAVHEENDRRLDLLQAIHDLPTKYRRVILLKYMHDLKLTDIAELLELPVGTVKTYQNKGLNLLREHYRDEIEDRRLARKTDDVANRDRLGKKKQAAQADYEMRRDMDMETEMAGLLHDLRSRAQELAQRNSAFADNGLEPFIEDVFRQQDAVSELLFIWTKPGTDTGVSVTLTPDGDLVDYAVDPELYEESERAAYLEPEELLAIGERFVRDHYPEAPERFGEPRTEDRGDRLFVTVSQYAAGMPLPRSGYWIDLHRSGFVTAFKYFGRKPEPSLPDDLLTPDEVLGEMAEELEMKLYFNVLHDSVYAEGDDRLHLVYMPEPYLIARTALRQGPDRVEEEPEEPDDYDPCAGAKEPIEEFRNRARNGTFPAEPRSPLELLGVREDEYEVLREADMGSERGIVYAKKAAPADSEKSQTEKAQNGSAAENASEPQSPYTLERYMRERSENTIKVRIDRESGRLSGVMDFREERGEQWLDNRACLDIALELLHAADPELLPYLRLDDRQDTREETPQRPEPGDSEEDEAPETARNRNAVFSFSVCKDGVPGFLNHVSIGVNRTTGRVNHYMGAGLRVPELEMLSPIPAFSPEEGKRLLLDALDLRLEWEIDYNDPSGEERYLPRYQPVSSSGGRSIRMIEAHQGTVITEKR